MNSNQITGDFALQQYRYAMARSHPRYFLPFVVAPDSRRGELFHFATVTEEEAEDLQIEFLGHELYRGNAPLGETSWLWQRDYLDYIVDNSFTSTLKARQLGISWIWDALVLWDLTFFAGIDDLIYSIKEDDAIEQINRIWDLWLSLPDYFKYGLKVLKPHGEGIRPSARIELEHPDQRVSTVTGMPATKKAGHGQVARRVLFDEAAHQDFARQLWKAIIPAAGDMGGNVGAVSTANGMSDGTGGGNFFHELHTGAGGVDYPKVKARFLSAFTHPMRDQEWYDSQNLDAASMAEQYPIDEDEAFLLSGNPFFDLKALQYYSREGAVKPKFTGEFQTYSNTKSAARFMKGPGLIEVYRTPTADGHYAIGADVATGDGDDYSDAVVIDLADGAPCAELRMKADYIEYTRQLHFLGKWFNNARLAVEKGGGFGDVVIAYLRDGHEGRAPYPMLYRHEQFVDPKKRQAASYGFPMNKATRAMCVSELNEWINQRHIPWLTKRFRVEARTFVRQTTYPSPRHEDGTNDDSILALGIALALYARYGTGHKFDRKKVKAKPRNRPTDPLDPRNRRRQT